MSQPDEHFYSAFAVMPDRLEEIDRYATMDAAIDDVLDMWCEDTQDVIIIDDHGENVARMRREPLDHRICHIRYKGKRPDETYRCEYVADMCGRTRTIVTLL